MIRHLPYFLVVAEELHFQRAADRLGITQSALSRRIRLLEEELDVKLFDRASTGVRLTPAGESFFQDTQHIRFDFERAQQDARDVARGLHGKINIGFNASALANPLISEMLRIFRNRNPDIQIGLKMMVSDVQATALHDQEVDVGILYCFTHERGLTYSEVSKDGLSAVAMTRDNPLASRPVLRVEDLADVPFVWPTRSVAARLSDRLIAECNAHGFCPRIEVEAHISESILSIVSMGLAVAFVSSSQAAHPPPGLVVREVQNFKVELPLCLAWRSTYSSPILPRLLSALDEVTGARASAVAAQDARLVHG